MRSVTLSAEAKRDLKDIGRYTHNKWGKMQANEYISKIRQQIELIRSMPAIGVDRTNEIGQPIFSFFVGNHAIYYMYDPEKVSVIAILHQMMLPQTHLHERNKAASEG